MNLFKLFIPYRTMNTKSIRKLYSGILIAGLGLSVLTAGLHAQRGAQDSWYLDKEVPLPDMPGLNAPHGFDITPNGDVYVVDDGNDRVSVWDANGSFLRAWGKYGTGIGQFNNPRGIAVTADEVYVTEFSNKRIQVFDLQGNFLRKWGSSGSGDGQFNEPWGITVDVVDANLTEVYVAEWNAHRIQVFDSNGAFRRKFGTSTLNSNPADVKIGPNGLVYVSSRGKTRIKVFQKDGTYLREFNPTYRPFAIDFLGNLLVVANADSHRVQIFETNGTLVTTIGSGTASSHAGLFDNNYGVAVSPSGDLHVSCRDNHRIQVFDANGTYKRSYGSYATAGVDTTDVVRSPENTFIFTDHSGGRVFETDENGTLVRILAKKGAGSGQVENPYGLDLGPDGRVYVSDKSNHRIQVFERNGTLARTFGSEGSSNGKFNQPRGIAVSQTGEVYVADTTNHRIQVFDLNGTFRRKFGVLGSLDGQMNGPNGLDLDDDGSVVIADYNNNRAVVFDANGTFLRKWTIHYKANQVTTLNDGLILFGGGGNTDTRLRLYEKDGSYVKEWNPGYGYPSPVACLPNGTLVLAHRGKDKLFFYRPTYRTIRPKQSKEIPFPEVISAAQRPGTDYLDLTYRINDADSPNVKAALLGFADGGTSLSKVIVPKTFVGDVTGKLDDNVSTGQTHTVTWNAGADWNVGFGEVEVAVLAQDDRDLLNLHFLNLPATDGNSTQLKISRSPVTDDDLLKIWYWLIASGHSGIEFTGGMVHQPQSTAPAGFSPASVPGLKLWLDANDVDGDGQADSNANDSNVSVWTDKAGGDHNATQTTESQKPTYKTNSLNGKSALFFDSSDDSLATGLTLVRPYTVVVLFNSIAGYTGERQAIAGSSKWFIGPWGSKISHHPGGWASNTLTWESDRYYLATAVNDGSKSAFYVDGVDYTQDSSRTSNPNILHLGKGGYYKKPLNGHIAEVLVWDEALSDANRDNVGKYLSEKWDAAYSTTPYALSSSTTDLGRAYLLNLTNLREATAEEVTRAKEGATSGTTNQFSPTFKVGPGERPVKVNEYGFDTGATSGFWVVPK
ncbi:MAG: hypothetical protein CMI26_06735 [Opitutae bacterium]|nr:hypothetical protein [Opitutae bacterium]